MNNRSRQQPEIQVRFSPCENTATTSLFLISKTARMKKHLVIGAAGQLGVELVLSMQHLYGIDQVVVADIRTPEDEAVLKSPFIHLDATDLDAMKAVFESDQFASAYHLAAMLSAVGEQRPLAAWDLNMSSLLNVLECAKVGLVERVFWPSSIAVFGPDTPKHEVPQAGPLDPTTVYGISKVAGESWCRYYHDHFGVDVRSLRYPGLIGHRSLPGGGTTDYAVDIFLSAVREETYTCFLGPETELPMMYIEDAVRATLELMDAPKSSITIRTSYNLSAMSFTPMQLAEAIRKHQPAFAITYAPDRRQAIADSWPASISDKAARVDWNWEHKVNLEELVQVMLDAWGQRLKGALVSNLD